MAQSKPVLYSYYRSSCSWRVRIALALKEIDYEYKGINLLKNEHLSPEFTAINPVKEVPVFVDNGKVLTQSSAILEYLEETNKKFPLLPSDPVARAHVRALVNDIVGGIQPLQNMRVLQRVGENSKDWGKHWIDVGFKALEKRLEATHGAYCYGDSITLADVCLVPQVYNANRFEVDLTQFPLISEISTRLSNCKAFAVSHPSVQPDTPDDA